MKKELTKKILFSPGIGIGFLTANPKFPGIQKDKHIIDLVERGTEPKKIIKYTTRKYGKGFDTRGIPQLTFEEMPIDEKYYIYEEMAGWEVLIREDLFLI